MTAFNPLSPRKAVELVEAAGIDHAERRVRDRAAAGLLKSYALIMETTPVSGSSTCVRDATIPTALWRRIVAEGADADVWAGDTVRLAGADLIGGAPAVSITGIRFHDRDIQRLIDHHVGKPFSPSRPSADKTKKITATAAVSIPASTEAEPCLAAAVPPIAPGAILATINQTMAATGFGRTKVNALMKAGTLVARKVGRSARIEVASIMALGGNAS